MACLPAVTGEAAASLKEAQEDLTKAAKMYEEHLRTAMAISAPRQEVCLIEFNKLLAIARTRALALGSVLMRARTASEDWYTDAILKPVMQLREGVSRMEAFVVNLEATDGKTLFQGDAWDKINKRIAECNMLLRDIDNIVMAGLKQEFEAQAKVMLQMTAKVGGLGGYMDQLVERPNVAKLRKFFSMEEGVVASMQASIAMAIENGEKVLDSVESLMAGVEDTNGVVSWVMMSKGGCSKAKACILLMSAWETLILCEDTPKQTRQSMATDFINDCLEEFSRLSN